MKNHEGDQIREKVAPGEQDRKVGEKKTDASKEEVLQREPERTSHIDLEQNRDQEQIHVQHEEQKQEMNDVHSQENEQPHAQEGAQVAVHIQEQNPVQEQQQVQEQNTIDEDESSPSYPSPAWQSIPWPEEEETDRERRVRRRNRPPVIPLRERTFYGCSSIDQYNLGVKLGQGTFGEVKKASHFLTGVEVALKKVTIHEEKDGMPITAIREIKLLKKVSHASIIAVVDMAYRAPTERGRMGEVFMVEPYMDHDLNGMLENPSIHFTPSQIKLYMKQLFEGTLYMHQVSASREKRTKGAGTDYLIHIPLCPFPFS
jgi:hypothetical protein